jgi:ABC-type bacteriocin/lantibiotic exporter with double-glycine peptidase domain
MSDTGTLGLEIDTCFLARVAKLARERGLSVNPREIGAKHGFTGDPVPLSTVLAVSADAGMPADHARLAWNDLGGLADRLPALMIFRDQSTAILEAITGTADATETITLREDDDEDEVITMDQDELGPLWAGDMLVFK